MAALTSAAHTHTKAYVFANSVYHMNTLPTLVQFLHRACFSPVMDTWCKSIDEIPFIYGLAPGIHDQAEAGPVEELD